MAGRREQRRRGSRKGTNLTGEREKEYKGREGLKDKGRYKEGKKIGKHHRTHIKIGFKKGTKVALE